MTWLHVLFGLVCVPANTRAKLIQQVKTMLRLFLSLRLFLRKVKTCSFTIIGHLKSSVALVYAAKFWRSTHLSTNDITFYQSAVLWLVKIIVDSGIFICYRRFLRCLGLSIYPSNPIFCDKKGFFYMYTSTTKNVVLAHLVASTDPVYIDSKNWNCKIQGALWIKSHSTRIAA